VYVYVLMYEMLKLMEIIQTVKSGTGDKERESGIRQQFLFTSA